ncbi:MAG: hypothetical protein JXK07_14620 [Spirochaetes bacterium]|nr:hypothetical protein [Spirochaetota bacterium]MBN2770228.1 hypothetical protein [Spirochaetota bacterium]
MKKLLSLLLAVSLLLTFAACDDEEEAPDRGTDPFNYFIDYQSNSGSKFSSPLINNSSDCKYLKVTTFDNPANAYSTYRNVSKIVFKHAGFDDKTFTYNSDGLLTEYKIDRNTTKFTFSDDSSFEFTGGNGSYNDNNMIASLNFDSNSESNSYTYDSDNRLTKQTVNNDTNDLVYEYTYNDDYLEEYTFTLDGAVNTKKVFVFEREGDRRPIKCTITESGGTSTIDYEYNDEGYVAKATLTGTDLEQTEEYTWSENGFLDKVVYKDKKAGTTITYDYEYSKGILLSIKKDGSDYKTYEITER